MLFNGERVGDGTGAECDVAVDPIDGTTLTAKGMPNAIAVLAAADRGTMFDPSAVFYMDKLVTGPEAADFVDIDAPVSVNIRRVAKAKRSAPEDVTVVVLDRPRHDGIVKEIRETGARIKFISDGDVAGSIMAAARGHRHRPAARHRRHARGHHLGLRRQVPGRHHPGQAVAQGRRGAAARAGRGPRPRPCPVHRRPGLRRERLLRRHRHHGRRAAARGALPRRDRDDRVDRHAVQVRARSGRSRRSTG